MRRVVSPSAPQRSEPLRGVNLGGWLVIEQWMTPSLFKDIPATNEFELAKTELGRRRIKEHHEKFITEEDLKWLKQRGIEALRVPVGYWIFGNDERYVAAIERLDWLVNASLTYGFKLLIDLHAAPGAQNHAAHSGSGNLTVNKYSTKWLNDISAQNQTIEVLVQLCERYRPFPHVYGFELLNEPSVDRFARRLIKFYRRAYAAVINVARPGSLIVFSDGYAPLWLCRTFLFRKHRGFPVAMDTHVYFCFGKQSRQRPFGLQLRRAHKVRWFIRFLSFFQPVIIGEWSAMLPYRVSDEQTSQFIAAQTKSYRPALAHFYWNYKTEAGGRWNWRDLRQANDKMKK
jgi:glucan 1,3-beta-glucosidase